MSGHRDPTAGAAIASAAKSHSRPHAARCRVDGGSRTHGRKGFHCPRCAELNADREFDLLVRLDRYAGSRTR